MKSPVEPLSDLRTQVAEALGGMTGEHLLHHASDEALVGAMALVGDIARLVEGVLIEGIAELTERSSGRATDERLTTRLGCHNVNELIQRLSRCSAQTAARFERAQRVVAPTWDMLTGEERPARLPALRAALLEGHVGADGVLAVAGPLLEMDRRVPRDQVLLADEVIAAHARGEGPDAEPPACAEVLRLHAQVWATALDQDGAEPRERDIAVRRGVTLGRARNGVVPVRGDLLPDVAAQLQRIADATYAHRPISVRFDGESQREATSSGGPAEEGPDEASDSARILDDRSGPQRMHDALALALSVAARSGELPTIGGAAPTLIVSARAEDVESDTGWATVEGCDEPVAPSVARHVGCSGIIQRVTLAPSGRVLRLGTEERLFNRHQRRALALRDGGCIIPGCGVPAGWCEVHHVNDHAKGGPTHIDNGVLLCWWHHRFIDTVGWRIRMNRGVPEVQAPLWLDPSGRWRPVTKSRIRMLELIGRRT